MWAEIGGKEFFAQQACVDKIKHAIGEAVELLPDMVNLGPVFTEIYSESKSLWSLLVICSADVQARGPGMRNESICSHGMACCVVYIRHLLLNAQSTLYLPCPLMSIRLPTTKQTFPRLQAYALQLLNLPASTSAATLIATHSAEVTARESALLLRIQLS